MTSQADTLTSEDFYIDLPEGQVFVRQWWPEATQKPPFILLHDSLGSVELWRDFPVALARKTGHPVIAYDRLGFGQSAARSDSLTTTFIQQEASIHLPNLTKALGLDAYLLMGHSVGGGMALTAAALYPTPCLGVITEAAQAFMEQQTLDGIRQAKKDFADPEQFDRLLRWHGDKAQWVLDAWTETWLAPVFRHWSLDNYLPQVQCPVLVLHGDQDEYGSCAFPRHLAQNVQGPAEMVILENCRHVPHREKQDEILALIEHWLEKIASQ